MISLLREADVNVFLIGNYKSFNRYLVFKKFIIPLQYQQNSAPCFVTLPRNPRRQQTPISVAGLGVAEVRLAPYFDGTGPRTSANGSMETQNQGIKGQS